jgi:hypothetical protein
MLFYPSCYFLFLTTKIYKRIRLKFLGISKIPRTLDILVHRQATRMGIHCCAHQQMAEENDNHVMINSRPLMYNEGIPCLDFVAFA